MQRKNYDFMSNNDPCPEIAALYAEFAEEDRALAEMGMADYSAGLAQEDTAAAVEEPPTNAPL